MNGVWRIGIGVAGAAALVAAAPEAAMPEAAQATNSSEAQAPASAVRAIASDAPDGGARLMLAWPADRQSALPEVIATTDGPVLVVRSSEPMAIALARLTSEAPGSMSGAELSDGGKMLRVQLRRAMQARVEKTKTAYAIALTPVEPSQAGAPATVTASQTPQYTRLAFRFSGPVTMTPLQRGDRLDLRFSRPAEIDLAALRLNPPRFLKSARVVSKPGERLALALDLDPGVRQRHFVEGSQAVLDLLAAPDPKLAEASAQPRPAARAASVTAPAGGVARLQVAETPTATTFSIRWSGPANAAAFRRGEALWMLFDANARISLEGAPQVGRRHSALTLVQGDGVTGVRISAAPSAQISARADGAAWVFTLSDRSLQTADGRVSSQREQAPAGVRLSVPFKRSGVVRWIDDPIVGDRFAVGLVPGPALGVAERRATLEAALLPTAHGAIAEMRADGVGAIFENGAFVVTRGQGLMVAGAARPLADEAAPVQGAADAMLDFAQWSQTPGLTPSEMLDQLHRRVADEGAEPGASATARMALARFLLSSDLAPEALGALRIASVNQPQLEVDPEFRLMRAAASLMMGRLADAQRDLSASGLAEDPTAALWRGYAASLSENWGEARRSIESGRGALSTVPRGWRSRFLLASAEAALRLDDLASAETDAASALGEADSPALRAQAQVLQARIARARGDTANALRQFDELAKSRDEASAVRASLEAIRLRRDLKQIRPEVAAEALDSLRFRWRGDALELETIQTLAFVYADLGRWRDGLTVMRQAAMRYGDHPAARSLRLDMAELFEQLFLDGGADKLDPIQALGLFYDFKDLTPYGPDGDRMVRLLAGRLTAMDLMEQAAALLQHQVDERLEGVGQAQIAADLAALYLSDNRPEQAIAALQNTRQPRLPNDLMSERRILEANALVRLGRFDHALEIVEKDRSPDAQRVRAEVAWRQKDWPTAGRAIEAVLTQRQPADGPLTPEDRDAVLRLAVAQVFAEDRAGLAATRRRFASLMAGTPDADTFDVITETPDVEVADIAEAVRRLARTDLLDRFMTRMRARIGPDAATTPGAASTASAGQTPPAG